MAFDLDKSLATRRELAHARAVFNKRLRDAAKRGILTGPIGYGIAKGPDGYIVPIPIFPDTTRSNINGPA